MELAVLSVKFTGDVSSLDRAFSSAQSKVAAFRKKVDPLTNLKLTADVSAFNSALDLASKKANETRATVIEQFRRMRISASSGITVNVKADTSALDRAAGEIERFKATNTGDVLLTVKANLEELAGASTQVEAFRQTVASASATIPVRVDFKELNTAMAAVEAFKRAVGAVAAQIRVNVDTQGIDSAMSVLQVLDDKARAMDAEWGHSIDISANPDFVIANLRIAELEAQLAALNGRVATVRVEANIAAALASLGVLSLAMGRISGRTLHVNASVGSGLSTVVPAALGDVGAQLQSSQSLMAAFGAVSAVVMTTALGGIATAATGVAGALAILAGYIGTGLAGAAGIGAVAVGTAGAALYTYGFAMQKARQYAFDFNGIIKTQANEVKASGKALAEANAMLDSAIPGTQEYANAQSAVALATQDVAFQQEKMNAILSIATPGMIALNQSANDFQIAMIGVGGALANAAAPALQAYLDMATSQLPLLTPYAVAMIEDMNGVAESFLNAATSGQQLTNIQTILFGIQHAGVYGLAIVTDMAHVLIAVLAGAIPHTEGLLFFISQLVAQTGAWVQTAEGTAAIAGAWETLAAAGYTLYQIVYDIGDGLYGLGAALAASATGQVLIGQIMELARNFSLFFSSVGPGQAAVTEFMNNMTPALAAIIPTAVEIASQFFRVVGAIAEMTNEATGMNSLEEIIWAIHDAAEPLANLFIEEFEKIGPLLAPLIENIAKWAEVFLIATPEIIWFIGVVNQLMDAFQTLDPSTQQLIARIMAWGSVVMYVAGTFAPLIFYVVGTIAAIAGLIGSVVGIVGGIAAMGITVSGIVALLPVFAAVLGIVVAAVMIAIAAVAAFAAVAYLVYQNWETVAPFLAGVWAVITSVIQSGMTVIRGIITVISGLISGDWTMVWNGIVMIVSGVWAAMSTVIQAGLTVLSAILAAGWAYITTTAGTAWAAVTLAVSTAWTAIYTTVSTWLTQLWTFITTTWTAIYTTIIEILTPVWTFIVTVFTAIYDTVSSVLTEILSVVTTIFTGIWTAISTILEIIGTVFVVMLAFWVGLFVLILTPVIEVVTSIFTGVSSAISTAMDYISALLSAAWTAIVAVVGPILQYLWDAVVAAFDGIYASVSSVMQYVSDFVTSTWQYIYATVAPILTAIYDWIVAQWTASSTYTTETFTAISTFLSETWQAIYTAVSAQLTAIYDWLVVQWDAASQYTTDIFTVIWDFLVATWQSIYDAVSPILTAIYDWLVSTWDSASSYTTEIFDSVYTYLSDTWNSIYEEVSTILDSLAEYVSTTWDAIIEGVSTFASGFLESVTTAFWDAVAVGGDAIATLLEAIGEAAIATGIDVVVTAGETLVGAGGSVRGMTGAAEGGTTVDGFARGGITAFAGGGCGCDEIDMGNFARGGMGTPTNQPRTHLWNEQQGNEAFIAERGPKNRQLQYLSTAAGWFGLNLVPGPQDDPRGTMHGIMKSKRGGQFAQGGVAGGSIAAFQLGGTHYDWDGPTQQIMQKLGDATGWCGTPNTYYGHAYIEGATENQSIDWWGGGRGGQLDIGCGNSIQSEGKSVPALTYDIWQGQHSTAGYWGDHYDHLHQTFAGAGAGGNAWLCRVEDTLKYGFEKAAGLALEAGKLATGAIGFPLVGDMLGADGGYIDTTGKGIIDHLASILPGCAGSSGGDCSAAIPAAVQQLGASPEYLKSMESLGQAESGMDMEAVNLYDSNAQVGTPSTGCWQMIPSTFAAHADPGCTDSKDPLCQAMSSINYQEAVHGGPVWESGYARGGITSIGGRSTMPIFQRGGVVPGSGPLVSLLHGGERVLTDGQNSNLEALASNPAISGGSGPGGSSGGYTDASQSNVYVTVNVEGGMGSSEQDMREASRRIAEETGGKVVEVLQRMHSGTGAKKSTVTRGFS